MLGEGRVGSMDWCAPEVIVGPELLDCCNPSEFEDDGAKGTITNGGIKEGVPGRDNAWPCPRPQRDELLGRREGIKGGCLGKGMSHLSAPLLVG